MAAWRPHRRRPVMKTSIDHLEDAAWDFWYYYQEEAQDSLIKCAARVSFEHDEQRKKEGAYVGEKQAQ